MKKALLIALAICMAFAGMAFAGVAGSLHDLGAGGASDIGTSSQQVCVFCHHPHRGASTAALQDALLWNVTAGDTAASYPVYTPTISATMNAASGVDVDDSANSASSYVCMSCHDGGVGANAIIRLPRDAGVTTTSALTFKNPASDLGSTLEDDHPINFTYNDAAGEIVYATGDTVTGDDSGNLYPLISGTMQCATCHDVHAGSLPATANNCEPGGGTPGNSCDVAIEFMNGNTAGSQICIDCHLNK